MENNKKTISGKFQESLPEKPWLSFRQQDIEKKFSFPAGRYTSPGTLMPLTIGIISTVAFYLLIPLVPFPMAVAMFTARGVIPYFIVLFFFWSLAILYIKYQKIKVQEEALKINILPVDDPGFIITPLSVTQVLDKMNHEVEDSKLFLLTRRINIALGNLRNIGNISDIDKILNTQSENDEALVDSSYTILRGFIWTLPVLGFIGTVLGLSFALGDFGGVLSSAQQMNELRDALQGVTGGLSTAFETTLQGLIATVIVQMLMIAVQRREEQFLDECKDYCQSHIVARLRLSSL